MDINRIVASTDRYNLHSHTQYCDGRASMYRMTLAAIDAGFKHWGFSPHSPVNAPSTCNMRLDDVPVYFEEVDRLRDMFVDQISLYAGMEIDYMSPDWGPAIQLFQDMPLDYRIGSVHFVPTRDGELIDCDGRFERFATNMHSKFNDDIRYVVETFFQQSIMMVNAGGFDIIGHLDKIAGNASKYLPGIESQYWYQSLVNELIHAVAEKGIMAEVNTKALIEQGRIFPSPSIIAELKQAGVTLIVNSDTHYPEKVNSGRDEALKLINEI